MGADPVVVGVGAPAAVAVAPFRNPVFCCSLVELELALAELVLNWIRLN